MPQNSSCKLIVGCGYLGARVAQRWQQAGEKVVAVTRSNDRAAEFESQGLAPLVADILRPETLRNLPVASTVLFAVGHDRTSGLPIEQVYVDGLRHVLEALAQPPERFVYISSTGVFGQTEGEEVTEASVCRPSRDGGRACLAAEQLLQQSEVADRAIILRLAGIYGPGRIPRVADIRAGVPIAAPADGCVNLIHVDDAARIVLACEQVAPPRLYVVSDGEPVERAAYYGELARLINAPAPTFTPPSPAAHVAQRAGSDKRVSPRRLFAEVPIALEYPSYREGLAAIVRETMNK